MRFGKAGMNGIDSLLDNGHTGIAEKHAVLKIIGYVQELEKQLGIETPEIQPSDIEGTIKVRSNGQTFYI